jgi:hypothetical protein
MNFSKGCHIQTGFPHKGEFERIIKKWMTLLDRYNKTLDDTIYLHIERAQIGLLSTSAWMTGNISLEEYATYKKHKKRVRKVYKSGRTDLYICLKSGEEFEFEAKILFDRAPKYEQKVQKIISKLRCAKDGCRHIDEHGSKVGLLFYIPWSAGSNKSKPIIDSAELIKYIYSKRNIIDYDVFAWNFPKESRDSWAGDNKSWFCYPGIMMFMRRLKR